MMATTLTNNFAETASDGATIALAGMLIVGFALTFISLFIAALPRCLAVIENFWPETDEAHGKKTHPESLVPDDGAVLAAIGFVLHTEMQKQLLHEKSASAGR